MKTAAHIFLAITAIITISACKKPKQDIIESHGLGVKNNTDKEITVKVHATFNDYATNRRTNDGYTFTVPAESEMVAPLAFGSYYIDWYSGDFQYSNWGTELDETFSSDNASNAVTFKFSETRTNYTINPNNTITKFLDTGGRALWTTRGAMKDGAAVSTKRIVELDIYKSYTVTVRYDKGAKTYKIFTKKFSDNMALTDSISQQYTIKHIPGPDLSKDTLLLKLPYNDTFYKLVRKET
jgi:hypothetical protein